MLRTIESSTSSSGAGSASSSSPASEPRSSSSSGGAGSASSSSPASEPCSSSSSSSEMKDSSSLKDSWDSCPESDSEAPSSQLPAGSKRKKRVSSQREPATSQKRAQSKSKESDKSQRSDQPNGLLVIRRPSNTTTTRSGSTERAAHSGTGVLQEADRVGAIMEVVGHSSSGCEQSSAPSRLDGRGPVDFLTSAVSSRARSAVSSSSPVIPVTSCVSDADTGKDTGDDHSDPR